MSSERICSVWRYQVTWVKLITTWMIIGIMFFAATVINHYFYQKVGHEVKNGYKNIETSLVKTNVDLKDIYTTELSAVKEFVSKSSQQEEETQKIIKEISQDVDDIKYAVDNLNAQVEQHIQETSSDN